MRPHHADPVFLLSCLRIAFVFFISWRLWTQQTVGRWKKNKVVSCNKFLFSCSCSSFLRLLMNSFAFLYICVDVGSTTSSCSITRVSAWCLAAGAWDPFASWRPCRYSVDNVTMFLTRCLCAVCEGHYVFATSFCSILKSSIQKYPGNQLCIKVKSHMVGFPGKPEAKVDLEIKQLRIDLAENLPPNSHET